VEPVLRSSRHSGHRTVWGFHVVGCH
jgi:hypothetical protein